LFRPFLFCNFEKPFNNNLIINSLQIDTKENRAAKQSPISCVSLRFKKTGIKDD
jgi:hypothetical protein